MFHGIVCFFLVDELGRADAETLVEEFGEMAGVISGDFCHFSHRNLAVHMGIGKGNGFVNGNV